MSTETAPAARGYVATSCVHRADGSCRRAVVTDERSNVLGQSYYLPGTRVDPNTLAVIEGRASYHWADQFTDAELAMDADGFRYPPETITRLRAEAEAANRQRLFVHKGSEV